MHLCCGAGGPPPPPPLCLPFPWWCRDHVCSPLWGSGRGDVDVFLAPRRAALALRREQPLPPPPRACCSPGFPPLCLLSPWRRDCIWLSPAQRRSGRCEASDFVLLPRGWGGCGEVVEAVSMSSSRLTGSAGVAARAALAPPPPRACHSPGLPPPRSLSPLGRDPLFVNAVEEEWQM